MRQYKYMLSQFTFYDRTGIQRMLEEKAEKGWLLDKVTTLRWRFRRIEPRKIHFAVTYFPKASAYDPGPSEQQKDLIDFCAHSGWILAATTAQMQIFYNEQEKPVPIETDPMIELENIHKSAKKNYLPAYITLGILAVLQIALQIGQLMTFPLTYISQQTTVFNWLCDAVLLAVCLMETLGYAVFYCRAKRAAENGEFVETKGNRKIQMIFLSIVIASFAYLLISMEPKLGLVMAVTMAALFGMMFGTFGIHALLKKKGVSTNTNRVVTIGFTVVATILVLSVMVFGTIGIMGSDRWKDDRVVDTVELYGWEFDIYADEIPLKVEHMMEVSTEGYSYEAREQSSVLLQTVEYNQRLWGSSNPPDLSYTVYTTSIPLIRNIVRKELLKPGEYVSRIDEYGNEYYNVYVEIDAAQWGAEEAWQLVCMDDFYWDFVVFFEDSIVRIGPGWEMTAEQMQIAGSILGK